MQIYRVTHQQYADSPFSGKGGLISASRWSSRGQLVTFASDTLALATLEKLAGVGHWSRLKEMVYVRADLDQKLVQAPAREALPEEWDRRPPGDASRDYGSKWLESKASVALQVPSVVLHEGSNYVLNPVHPSFEEALSVGETRPLDLDPRIADRLVQGG